MKTCLKTLKKDTCLCISFCAMKNQFQYEKSRLEFCYTVAFKKQSSADVP